MLAEQEEARKVRSSYPWISPWFIGKSPLEEKEACGQDGRFSSRLPSDYKPEKKSFGQYVPYLGYDLTAVWHRQTIWCHPGTPSYQIRRLSPRSLEKRRSKRRYQGPRYRQPGC